MTTPPWLPKLLPEYEGDTKDAKERSNIILAG